MYKLPNVALKIGFLCIFTLAFLLLPLAGARANPKSTPNFTLSPIYPSSLMPQAAVGQTIGIVIYITSYSDINWAQGTYPIDIDVVEVHHEGNPGQCSQSAIKLYTMQSGSSDRATISLGYPWPSAANSNAYGSPYFAVCLHQEVPSGVTSSDFVSGTTADIGTANIFEVVNDNAPSIQLSATTIPYGNNLTVSGSHWFPYFAEINDLRVGCSIVQYPYTGATKIFASQAANVDSQSNFILTFPISASYPIGSYYASCGSVEYQNYKNPGISIKIVASLPPTTTPATSTPTIKQNPITPTPTMVPTSTPTISNGGISSAVNPTQIAQAGPTHSTTSEVPHGNSNLPFILIPIAVALVTLTGIIGIRNFRRTAHRIDEAMISQVPHISNDEPTQIW